MSWIQARIPGGRVIDAPDLLIADSGIANDTFNFVFRARLAHDRLHERVHDAIATFEQVGRPFSWWVGPSDQPADLGDALARAGLSAAEAEQGMAATLSGLAKVDVSPSGLRIERATRVEEIMQFARLMSALWSPPEPTILAFYSAAAPYVLGANAPFRFYLGYLGDRPVATAEVCIAGGVAGVYNISTIPAERGRGFGAALTVKPLLDARDDGIEVAILQAAGEAERVYRRVGFRSVGKYVEYQPRPKLAAEPVLDYCI
jgi:GNAT superfamily N-acetyltransferase